MAIFRIEIERYYLEEANRGNQLKGMFYLQYPIYCIHSNIIDATPDALDNLDSVIVSMIAAKSNFTASQIGSLLGSSKALIELRLNALERDDLIEKKQNKYHLRPRAVEVFQNQTQLRYHKFSYDFYIDGITFKPLPKAYYSHYHRSKFISEHDYSFYANAKGESKVSYPFLPDLVHTPPVKEVIEKSILEVKEEERDDYAIPQGLLKIEDISYTKMSLQVLVSVCTDKENRVQKTLLDGFANYTLHEQYLETLRKNVRTLDENLAQKISNLEFRMITPRSWEENDNRKVRPLLVSNWSEIDNYKNSEQKCFSFTNEDLKNLIKSVLNIKEVSDESVINTDNRIELSINKKMLLESTSRQKLLNDLLRERDYIWGGFDNGNVYFIYLYYKTDDPFVQDVLEFKQLLNQAKEEGSVNMKWVHKQQENFSHSFRGMLIAGGEFEALEQLDIEMYMESLYQ